MARRACTAMVQLADYTERTGTTNHEACVAVDSLGNRVTGAWPRSTSRTRPRFA